ncbi:P-loop containing nucleoside triphosphate hydrolase protein [Pisolithus marmoratus]|nr:P-loop containing nucleoside triphosphate hydrolase protein [Pisolithus marmoratus]
MSSALSTVTPKLFLDRSSQIVFEIASDDSLDARHLRSFLSTVMAEGAIGISASYRENCQLSTIAFSSPSRALVVQLASGNLPLGNNESKRKRIMQGRNLLQKQILCNADYQKYAFEMDRIAIALYLDVALRIDSAVHMLSVSSADRRSLQALMDAMGGELTLHKSDVEALFLSNESRYVSNLDLVQQAWAACQAAIIPHMAVRFHALGRIRTNTMSDAHMAALAKISRDGELLDSLKPLTVKNDVMPDTAAEMDNLRLTCSRYPTRIRTSTQQILQIETHEGVQVHVPGRAVHVKGREARIDDLGPFHRNEIKSVTTIGKADLTSAEACRESVILAILKGESSLLSHPLFKAIWLPNDPICWPQSGDPKPQIPICCPGLETNTSQKRAIEKILSASDNDRVVLIQGAPGTGKTTVITAAVTSIISCPAAIRRTIWIAAQSNVAVKNIAEKFDKIDFHNFKLLVSFEFHFDWHEHLYERLTHCVVRSDSFSKDLVDVSRELCGARVILCTLGMLSNDHIAPYVQLNPVDILIFDEGSQIEVGNYVPVLRQFGRTLSKIAFIGDHKQLPPYGQEDISTLQSIFEVKHLRKEVLFLDTQYRMPSAIGDFISQKVYNGKLKTCHENSVSLPCRFVNVERGQEKRSGKSWINPFESRTVVQIAGAYQAKGLDFRIITPYDAQRSLIEHELQEANVSHKDKVFNVDSFQGSLLYRVFYLAKLNLILGNEAEHIIISVVRSDKLGFLVNQRRTNVMLTRCKKTMVICTTRAFISGPAASTLIGELATTLGPQAWVYGNVQCITPPRGTVPPRPNTHLTAHQLSAFARVADIRNQGSQAPASSPTSLPSQSSPPRSRRRNTPKRKVT